MPHFYDFSAKRLDGRDEALSTYRGKVLLIVNTASRCGFSPQLAALAEMHRDYASRGFSVLAFPCNQFGRQEPLEGEDIGTFCQRNYGVDFPVFAKIPVNGADTHPLFRFLKSARPGLLGTRGIKWNFTKFLVDRHGEVVARYAPMTAPAKLREAVEALLREDVPHTALAA